MADDAQPSLPPEMLMVSLGLREYPIHVGSGLAHAIASSLEAWKGEGRACALVIDAELASVQEDWLRNAFADRPRILLPAGERTKCFQRVEEVCEFLAASRMGRSDLVVAVGGGVIGDLAGFAAAVFLRGVDCVQVPTTLLAMVDSSVGGKTGVNLAAGKNLAGCFWQPRSVFCDTSLLSTLPQREFAAGMAEVIKYGLLADRDLFHRLEATNPPLGPTHPALPSVIRRCCEIKAAIVAGDERENAPEGGRALLNLGHTFGHALENAAGYGVYLHGEAVAVGLVLACRLSQELGWVDSAFVSRVIRLLRDYNLPTRLRSPLPLPGLMDAMGRDKKAQQGAVRFVAVRAPGLAVTVDGVAPALVMDLWREAGAEG